MKLRFNSAFEFVYYLIRFGFCFTFEQGPLFDFPVRFIKGVFQYVIRARYGLVYLDIVERFNGFLFEGHSI